MSEWRETTLGPYLAVRHGYAFKGEYFRAEGELVVLTPGNFIDKGGFKAKGGAEKYYEGPFPPEFLLRRGDVVVAMTEQAHGLLGSTATVPDNDRYLHNQRLGLLQIRDAEALDLRFCYHLLNASGVRRQIQATATGSKVRHTAPERLRALSVRLPAVRTQVLIAQILDTLDGLIENNRRRVQVLEEMARAVYREWFVHFRYPGHETAAFGDSPLGPIPEGWGVHRLDRIAHVNHLSRTPGGDEVIRYLDISSLGNREINEMSFMKGSEAPGRARRVVRSGDIVWSMVRPNRRSHALLLAPGADWIASTGLAVLTPTGMSSTLLFEMLSTQDFTDYLVSQEGGAAYPAVKAKVFKEAPLLIPPATLDSRFMAVVGETHRLTWQLRQQASCLAVLRDLLLPKLVTGQIDVSTLDLDSLVEGAVA